jgi:hypothetical protein
MALLCTCLIKLPGCYQSRLRHGAKSEVLPLTELRGVKLDTARLLYKAGGRSRVGLWSCGAGRGGAGQGCQY